MRPKALTRFLSFQFGNLKSKTCPELCRRIQNLKWAGILATLVLGCVGLAEAQQQAGVPKIGWLAIPGPGSGRELFGQEFRKLGYVEGKNIAIEYRSAEGKLDRLPALADELVRLKVDVLITSSTNAALALKNATRTIPIVFLGVSDPVADGLVDSLARPGGNITGFTIISAVLAGKRLELLKETIPKLSRVAVLWNPKNKGSEQSWKESQLAARELGLQLHSAEASSTDKFEGAFKEATKARSAALAVIQSPLAASNQKQIAELAARNRLPAIYPRGDYVVSGGLMSYGADQVEAYKRAAVLVDKILKGSKPADLPVEQPTKFEFVINLKTAKQIGLTIPPNVLARADRVIR
ncbi:MAG TPA: ABC transporter substrate-binding protein [Candidatus Binatia bacterium]|nr:ABC transporter substrate-binding protein [Candidatus Binatia bacterium]